MGFRKMLHCPKCGCSLFQVSASHGLCGDLFSEPGEDGCRPKCCCGPEPKPEPPDTVCPESGLCNRAYAQYAIYSNRASDTLLPFREIASGGGLTTLTEDDGIVFARGYIYYVSYTLLATPEAGNYYQVTPIINGSLRLNFSTFTTSNERRSASASAGFLIHESAAEDAVLRLRLVYPPEVNNIDLSGGLNVFPVAVA